MAIFISLIKLIQLQTSGTLNDKHMQIDLKVTNEIIGLLPFIRSIFLLIYEKNKIKNA